MLLISVSFIASLLLCALCIRLLTNDKVSQWLADHDMTKIQSVHTQIVPRVGGIPIFLAAFIGVIVALVIERPGMTQVLLVLVSALTVFAVGLLEDFTKVISPTSRMLAAIISAILLIIVCNVFIRDINIPFMDKVFIAMPIGIAMLLTIICVCGLIHSINIIDGLNGLASMVALMIFFSLAYVSFQLNDIVVLSFCLIMLGAIAGFFIWNYPAGLLFLGDGGAYFLGFSLSATAILLTIRNPTVSTWYPVLLFIYPVFETIYTIYRRKITSGVSVSQADASHLHSLIYQKGMMLVLGHSLKEDLSLTQRNSIASLFLWVLCALAVIPATMFWNNTNALFFLSILFCGSYIYIYRKIM